MFIKNSLFKDWWVWIDYSISRCKKSSVLKITFEPSLGSAKFIILPLINFFIIFI